MLRSGWIASLVVAAALAGGTVRGAETCHAFEGQFAKVRICVSSVLAPQAGNTYGPDHLMGTGDGAWCEGVAGPGIGQNVTIHQDPPQVMRTINVMTGYTKSEETFRNNGRVKTALIETDRGAKKTVTLKDTRESQEVVIPKSKVAWVKLTILDVYPGARGSDTCMSMFLTNLEEFGNE
jgi:hypothetical protein